MSRTPGAKDKRERKPRSDGGAAMHSPIIQDQLAEQEEGYNSAMVSFIMAITPSEPLDRSNVKEMVKEMERRFDNYLQMCATYDKKVGNQAAYLAIGIDKETAWNWLNRASTNPLLVDFIKKVQKICSVYRENLMSDGKVNPVTGIFWQKNYDGMKDQQEVVLTPNNPLGEQKDAEELSRKYLETAEVAEIAEGAERAALPNFAEGQKEDFSKIAEGAERALQS